MTNTPLANYQSKNGYPAPHTNDPVNHPSHYCKGVIECFDAMVSAFAKDDMIAYCRIAAFKYIWRAGDKGPMNQDLKKAIWYLNKAAEMTETPVV